MNFSLLPLQMALKPGRRLLSARDSKTWKVIVVAEGGTNSAPPTVTFEAGGVQTQQNKPYYLRLTDKNMLVTGITLVYSSEL